jgi:hypothetical protein
MPVVGACNRIPSPIRTLGVDKNYACASVFLVIVRPHIEMTPKGIGLRPPCTLKPGMLVGGVIDDEFGNDPYSARMCGAYKPSEVGNRAVVGMNAAILANIVTVVQARRRIEWQEPNGVHPEVGDIIKLRNKTGKVADPVVIGVEKRLHVQLIDDRILVPQEIFGWSCKACERYVHRYPPDRGAMRQIANGRSPGSNLIRCSLPLQTKL